MASKSLIGLPEVTTLANTDEILVSSGGQAGNPRRATFTTLAAMFATGGIPMAGGVLTASAPATLSQTWNNAGVTFVGRSLDITNTASAAASLLERWRVGGSNVLAIDLGGHLLAADGTAAAPIYAFSATAATGFFRASATQLGVTLSGTARVYFTDVAGAAVRMRSNGGIAWTASGPDAAADLSLSRDAANTLAQVNGTTAQALRVYNTFTSSTNYERAEIAWSGNVLTIGATAQTGTVRAVTFVGASFAMAGVVNVASTTATPAGGSTSARLLFGTTAGFGIYYGSGAPSSLTAAQGSLYLRSDGSGIADRLYVNTTGSTTWANFVSSA